MRCNFDFDTWTLVVRAKYNSGPLSRSITVSAEFSRMDVRIEGEPLRHKRSASVRTIHNDHRSEDEK